MNFNIENIKLRFLSNFLKTINLRYYMLSKPLSSSTDCNFKVIVSQQCGIDARRYISTKYLREVF